MDFSVPCCDIQHIFFFMAIQGNTQLSKLSIRNKLNLEIVFCRIIAVLMPKPIRKMTLKRYSVFLAVTFNRFVFAVLQGSTLHYKNFQFEIS